MSYFSSNVVVEEMVVDEVVVMVEVEVEVAEEVVVVMRGLW